MPASDGTLWPWEERALKTAHRRVPMLKVPRGGVCRWCERTIMATRGKYIGRPSPHRSWCREETEGRDCWYEHELHSRAETQAYYLFGRDGPFCRDCRAGGYAAAYGPIRSKPDGMTWAEFYAADKSDFPVYTPLKPSIALEVDHVVPLWRVAMMTGLTTAQRRAYFGPANLQFLCVPCHKAKSKREAAERAELRRRPTDR